MGFDVSYHPMSVEEMRLWYFDRLPEIRDNNEAPAREIAAAAGVEDFYKDRYVGLLHEAAEKFDGTGYFESTHGYALAAMQGFFRTYYYTRQNSLTGLFEANPSLETYSYSIAQSLGFSPNEQIVGKLPANYAAGMWLAPECVDALLGAYASDKAFKKAFDDYYGTGQATVVLKALRAAQASGLGVLEASEIIEPNPFDLNSSKSLSNLFNCDPEGALLYQQIAVGQLRDAGIDM